MGDPEVMDAVVESLDASACWAQLRDARVGRIAAHVDGQVALRPVNFAVDHGTLLIRTGDASVISRMAGLQVQFEADGHETAADDPGRTTAWSVIVDGVARLVRSTDEFIETVGVPLYPWHAAPKPYFVRVVPSAISGRRFTVVDPSTWGSPLDEARRTDPE
jgi:uncharacterized protein